VANSPPSAPCAARTARALALGFSRLAEHAAIDLVLAPDAPTGRFRPIARPGDPASAELSASLEGIAASAGQRTESVPETPAAESPTETIQAALLGPTGCGYLRSGHGLNPGQSLYSCQNGYRLTMQTDGNLVAYTRWGQVVWASGTNRRTPRYLVI
jgi:hypothetical protein